MHARVVKLVLQTDLQLGSSEQLDPCIPCSYDVPAFIA